MRGDKDTICACWHWFDEHFAKNGKFSCDTCEVAEKDGGLIGSPCENFVFDPEQNTPESIADRGGEHDLRICDCALCDASRKKFIGEVRGALVRDEGWRGYVHGDAFVELVSKLLDEVDFGPRPHNLPAVG